MLIDLIFVITVVVLLIAIYKIKFSKPNKLEDKLAEVQEEARK